MSSIRMTEFPSSSNSSLKRLQVEQSEIMLMVYMYSLIVGFILNMIFNCLLFFMSRQIECQGGALIPVVCIVFFELTNDHIGSN